MFANGPLARCRERKEELLRQCAVQRGILEQEATALRGLAGWVDLGVDATRTARLAWGVIAPLLNGGGKSRAIRLASCLAQGVSLSRTLMKAWQSPPE